MRTCYAFNLEAAYSIFWSRISSFLGIQIIAPFRQLGCNIGFAIGYKGLIPLMVHSWTFVKQAFLVNLIWFHLLSISVELWCVQDCYNIITCDNALLLIEKCQALQVLHLRHIVISWPSTPFLWWRWKSTLGTRWWMQGPYYSQWQGNMCQITRCKGSSHGRAIHYGW